MEVERPSVAEIQLAGVANSNGSGTTVPQLAGIANINQAGFSPSTNGA